MLFLRFWKKIPVSFRSPRTGKQATSSHERTIRLLPAKAHFYRLQLVLLRHSTGESAPAGMHSGQIKFVFLKARISRAWQAPSWKFWTLKTTIHCTRLCICKVHQSLRGGTAEILLAERVVPKFPAVGRANFATTCGVSQLLEGEHQPRSLRSLSNGLER